jgi:hypothetical protein
MMSGVLTDITKRACRVVVVLNSFSSLFHVSGHTSYLFSVGTSDSMAKFECGGGDAAHAVSDHFSLQIGVEGLPCFAGEGYIYFSCFCQ